MRTQQIIDQLPDQAKRSVLFSLVGSLNASVVGTAASMVSQLSRQGFEFKELHAAEAEFMLGGMDNTIALDSARKTALVAQNLRDQLLAVSTESTAGSLEGTIKFMSQPNAQRLDGELFKTVMEAAGLDMDFKHFEMLNTLDAAQRAARLANDAGSIEWLIGNVLSTRSAHAGDFNEDFGELELEVEMLNAAQQERLHQKLHAALQRARDDTVMGVLRRDTRYTFSDLSLIAGALKDFEKLDAHDVGEQDVPELGGQTAPINPVDIDNHAALLDAKTKLEVLSDASEETEHDMLSSESRIEGTLHLKPAQKSRDAQRAKH